MDYKADALRSRSAKEKLYTKASGGKVRSRAGGGWLSSIFGGSDSSDDSMSPDGASGSGSSGLSGKASAGIGKALMDVGKSASKTPEPAKMDVLKNAPKLGSAAIGKTGIPGQGNTFKSGGSAKRRK